MSIATQVGVRSGWRRYARRSRAWGLTGLLLQACQADPGHGGRTTADWTVRLQDSSSAAREEAARALGAVLAVNPRLAEPAAALIAALSDTVDAVRVAASVALAQPGVRVQAATEPLAAMLADSTHEMVRVHAVYAIGTIAENTPDGTARREMLRAVLPLHTDPGISVRIAVAKVLADALTATPALGALPGVEGALLALARDPIEPTRAAALGGLALNMTPRALATMLSASLDASPTVRALSARVLAPLLSDARVGEQVMAPLLTLLTDRAATVRLAAVRALGTLDTRDPAARQTLDAALRAASADADSLVRREARHALSRFHVTGGKDPTPPEPTLAERCAQLPPRSKGC
jgi:HEAT repeat protein